MSSHSKKRKKTQSSSSIWRIINGAFLALFSILSSVFIFKMYQNHFLAFRYINHLVTVVLFAIFLVSFFLLVTKKAKILTSTLLVLFSFFTGAGLYLVQSTVQVAEKLNHTASYSEHEMKIVVPTDSEINDVNAVSSLLAPLNNDATNVQDLLADVKANRGVDLAPVSVESYQIAYDQLLAGTSQAMVLNSAYSSLLELSHPDFEEKIKTIYTYKVTKKIQVEQPAEVATNQNVVNIYISGIDTFGSISTVSRSDVNIIMTVNMDTHKILLTTTPRDSYVQIPDGGANQYDKLTHAGIYGVETSMKTLENLYGIDIHYYARINFTSFLNLIDALGGIEVDNEQAFSAGGYDFPVGTISLSSEQALRFVRERYRLQAGDADRGRNQQKVIAAIINKLASFNSVANFSTIINSLQDSVQTNMSLDKMMELANKQLSSGTAFAVTSQDVTGIGSTGQLPSYAMPGYSLYMLSIDETSLNTAKEAIQNTMEGK
ncbi:LCP family glycopolymer transferase CpsA [Streptococcus cameli]